MFQLTKVEAEALRSQIATSNDGRREIGAKLGEHDRQLDQIFKTLRQPLKRSTPHIARAREQAFRLRRSSVPTTISAGPNGNTRSTRLGLS